MPTAPESLPTEAPRDRVGQPLLVAAALQRVAGELQAEGGGLGVDAVGAAHAEGVRRGAGPCRAGSP